jgi:DNA-binding response OmpR family regulator
MRILVADQNALLLAAITATFGRHCDVVTATRRDACMALVERQRFDVSVACDTLEDYTGLELLSEIAALSPGTLLIFAATTARLKRLGHRLDHFGLLGTLSYPLAPRKLLNALKEARRRLPPRPKIRHVVLDSSEWDTGERLGLVEKELEARRAAERAAGGDGEVDEFVFEGPPPKVLPVAARVEDAAVYEPRRVEGPPGVVARGLPPVDQPRRPDLAVEAPTVWVAPRIEGAFSQDPRRPDGQRGSNRADDAPSAAMPAARTEGSGAQSQGRGREAPSPGTPAVRAEASGAQSQGRLDGRRNADRAREAPPSSGMPPAPVRARRDIARSDAPTMPDRGRVVDGGSEELVFEAAPPEVSAAPDPSPFEQCSNDPVFDGPPPAPQWAEDGAANDIAFGAESAAPTTPAAARDTANAQRSAQAVRDAYLAEALQMGLSAHAAKSTGAGKSAQSAQPTQPALVARPTQQPQAPQAAGSAQAAKSGRSAQSGQLTQLSQAAESTHAAKSGRSTQSGELTQQSQARRATQQTQAPQAAGSTQSARSSQPAKTTRTSQAATDRKNGAQARSRAPSVPTASQLAAFERAMARRNEGYSGNAARVDGALTGAFRQSLPTSSLSDLARMATGKRPLANLNLPGIAGPKRAAFAVGSGLAAVVIVGVLTFELLRTHHEVVPHHAQGMTAQVFGPPPSSFVDRGESSASQSFASPPQVEPTQAQRAAVPVTLPQPQRFDPDTAPPDPPPPPALEHPGPMEPPSLPSGFSE